MPINLEPISRISDDPKITTKGSFMAGTTSLFFFTFADIEGHLFDPVDITITILDRDGNEVTTNENADRLEMGQYVLSWDIPADQTPGYYSIRVDYTAEQPDGEYSSYFTESFSILESDVAIIEPSVIVFRSAVEYLIGYTQRIPVFHEIGRLDNTKTSATFSFPRWNQPAGAQVFINGSLKNQGEGYEVDFLKGKINFSSFLSDYDEVRASYSFRWFTDDELDAFVENAVNVFNQYPPHTVYNVVTLSTQYSRAGVTVAHQAAVFALRRLIMDLHFQEPAKVFGGMDRADRLMATLEELKKNMEESLKELYDNKKRGPYVGLTKTITVPEFTLPGGRSRWFRYLFK